MATKGAKSAKSSAKVTKVLSGWVDIFDGSTGRGTIRIEQPRGDSATDSPGPIGSVLETLDFDLRFTELDEDTYVRLDEGTPVTVTVAGHTVTKLRTNLQRK